MHKVHTPIGGRKDGRTDGRKAKNHVPLLFFEKAGDNKCLNFKFSTACTQTFTPQLPRQDKTVPVKEVLFNKTASNFVLVIVPKRYFSCGSCCFMPWF